MKASFLFIIFTITIDIYGLSSLVNSQADSCSSNPNLNGIVSFDTTSLQCAAVWNAQGFILRYNQTSSNVWSYVLSAPDTNSFIAMGFSTNGMMVGSSAVVGWISSNGTGFAKQYFLGGTAPSLVVVDQGNLQLVNNSASIASLSSRLYLSFQLQTNQPQTRLLYSVGPTGMLPLDPTYTLTEHRDMASISINYVKGQTTSESPPYLRLRRSHGVLNMLGWGILMIIGVIVARYLKHKEPMWFYLHGSIQSFGFILGIAGVFSGFILKNNLKIDVSTHKDLGIFILVLGCLQVMALLARPDKASKIRNYWNWYHYIFGRILIIFAIANIFYGIHLAETGNGWRTGYGVIVAIFLIIVVVLELRIRFKK